MPELPEVETVARDLRELIVGVTITGAAGDWPRTIASHATVDGFAEDVVGRRVEAVGRRAKLVVVELSGGAALTIHLKMTGQVFVVPATTPRDRHVHLRLALADGREIRFRDIRKFGRVGLWPRDPATGAVLDGAEGAELFAALGPEPLDDAFTLGALRERLRGRRGRLKPLLLDQGFIAGVGNIYADEALWRSRLHPLRSVATLRPPDEARLHSELRAILAEAIERRGSSIDDYTAPEGDGSMQERLDVYQRTGQPCPRCGRPIRRVVVGARATHFCSWCQRLPAGDRPGAATILAGARSGVRAAAEGARQAAAARRAGARVGTRESA
ncbi:MAG TPA: bifunctional DNA-formamidopyrimidine glycosylase/DNA-(apurinic or apyrimidinic site) lyase [Patescibacteria group bacterium]|nr:bifunctional DNA-formamidopyrimidine glycosylase/DNA-(apurinic or apyrimidinic site) lyase [Patescibacteria group bacterium]